MRYRITQGGSIHGPDRKRYTAGMIVPDGFFRNQKAHISSGYLTPVNDNAIPEPQRPTEVVPGRDVPIVLKGNKEDKSEVIRLTTEHTPTGEPIVESTRTNDVGTPVTQVQSPWMLAPETLAGKGLEELNVMVHERDATIPPFEDPAEARAQLSQDYIAPLAQV